MSIFGWGEKPKPQVKTTESDDTEAFLRGITKKMMNCGGLPDTRTTGQRLEDTMCHTNAGRSWADAHRFRTDEQLAAEQSRLTVKQQQNKERFKYYVAAKEEQTKRP